MNKEEYFDILNYLSDKEKIEILNIIKKKDSKLFLNWIKENIVMDCFYGILSWSE